MVQLSDEVKLLLDRIFKVNEKERITIEGIKEDPWYSAPLPPKYIEAEENIAKQQRKVEEQCMQRALNPVRLSLLEQLPCPAWSDCSGLRKSTAVSKHNKNSGSGASPWCVLVRGAPDMLL